MMLRMEMKDVTERMQCVLKKVLKLLLTSLFSLNPDKTDESPIKSQLLSLNCFFLYYNSWPNSFKFFKNKIFMNICIYIYTHIWQLLTFVSTYFQLFFFSLYAYNLGLLKNSWDDKTLHQLESCFMLHDKDFQCYFSIGLNSLKPCPKSLPTQYNLLLSLLLVFCCLLHPLQISSYNIANYY